ncbi:MAG: tetratricopeptide repeat protein [Planctomycetota bacterium]
MGRPRQLSHVPAIEPEIFFLPLSVPNADEFDGPNEPEPGILSRRLPHLLHLMLNDGDSGPTGLLEVHSPPDDGPPHWVTLQEPVDPRDALSLLPDESSVRAIVTGVLQSVPDALLVELSIHLTRRGSTHSLLGRLDVKNPVAGLRDLARHLAKRLDLPRVEMPRALLTQRGDAFFKFLEGLDGAALLSSDLDQGDGADCETLLRPFCDALKLDPSFALALRTAHMTIANGLEASRLSRNASYRSFDRCFRALPTDGDGCVAIAEHLAVLGDDDRAQAWLEHATKLEPPAPRALENLGILFANRGDTEAARDLWLRGLEVDGHPDFLAHLARLAFADKQPAEAWARASRALRRVHERCVRAAEFDDDGRGAGLILRYLVEHFEDETVPEEITEQLLGLRGVLLTAEDRVELGQCLLTAGEPDAGRKELIAGLSEDVELTARDQGLRALLALDVPDFEKRFASAAEGASSGDDPGAARDELHEFLDHQPGFWPALYFVGIADQRLGEHDRALRSMQSVLDLRPDQPDALAIMADLYARKSDLPQALECIDRALGEDDDDARLHAARARYLHASGRHEEALAAADRAVELAPDERELRKLRRDLE